MSLLQQSPAVPAPPPVTRRPLPSWPIDVLLWGFPVYWLLGLTPFMVILMAAVMGVLLVVRRGLTIVPGIAPWLAFVTWAVPCALMLDSGLRLVGYAQRTSNYLAIAVILLYVVNAREHLTTRRIIGGLTLLWVTVIAGGYAGMLFPTGRLTTPVGLLLPESITGNEYVRDLVFPPLAEVQKPWGATEAYIRPSAPFPYTNGWGSAMALLTPVALAQILLARSTMLRVFLVLCLAAAVAPAVATLNRGLLLGVALSVGYVAVRLALRGRVAPFLALVAAMGAAGAAALSGGLLERLSERADYGSTDDRGTLYQETFDRTLNSPLLGYGAPRPSELLDISVGTQGQFWMVMFSFGFVGLGLFVWFLAGAVLRTWRAPATWRLWLHSSLLTACTLIFFYGLDTMQLLTVALLAAVLLRDPAATRPRRVPA
ncbi:ligase [Amycolatopsis antarctica]|uniref:Ligase n=1 Tax=Amycolatopsis antarctica TaxID=1854586 RepID=A0A263CYC8_9PSEU|nr:hypothetical protein [Amycolatopsis antarctica]OZM70336.1 ligase [Amycolatopsis antarctica]